MNTKNWISVASLTIYRDDITDENKFPFLFIAGRINEYKVDIYMLGIKFIAKGMN